MHRCCPPGVVTSDCSTAPRLGFGEHLSFIAAVQPEIADVCKCVFCVTNAHALELTDEKLGAFSGFRWFSSSLYV